MAEVYRVVDGKPVEDFVAGMGTVQVALSRYAFEMRAYADALLIEAVDYSLSIGRHVDFSALIDVSRVSGVGREAGYLVTLDDTRGAFAALNIEQGRLAEYFDRVTGMPRGGMAGLYILENATQAVADRHRSELRGG